MVRSGDFVGGQNQTIFARHTTHDRFLLADFIGRWNWPTSM